MSARDEIVRMRGFLRAAETQATKALDALDAEATQTPAEPDPVPEEPEPTPDPSPVPQGLVHAQDWTHLDVGYVFPSQGRTVTVVDPGLPGWPSRALSISPTGTGWTSVGESGWPMPEVGQTIYFSFLLYNDLPDDARGMDHGMQSGIGPIAHMWQFMMGAGETQNPATHFALGFQSALLDAVWYNPELPKRTTLTVQWALHRVAETEFTVDIRVDGGGQSWTTEDWRNGYGLGPESIAGQRLPITDLSHFTNYLFGTSGSGLVGSHILVGDFRVSLEDWPT